MSEEPKGTDEDQQRRNYEPPRITVLGTVSELTHAVGTGTNDAAVFSLGISDRRLKTDLRPVAPASVLSTFATLGLR
jgi:hypothetical protein